MLAFSASFYKKQFSNMIAQLYKQYWYIELNLFNYSNIALKNKYNFIDKILVNLSHFPFDSFGTTLHALVIIVIKHS